MKPSFEIRRATVEDALDIGRTHCASWRSTYPGLIPDTVIAQFADEHSRVKKWHEIIETEAESRQAVWIAHAPNHACLGFANAGARANQDASTDGQLRAIYLRKEAQGRGIGGALMYTAFAWMYDQGYRSVCVEVLKDNPAELFYRGLGGEHVFTTVFEMGGHPLTEHVYVWERLDAVLLAALKARVVAP